MAEMVAVGGGRQGESANIRRKTTTKTKLLRFSRRLWGEGSMRNILNQRV
jgi:hypothetical protein